MKTLMTVIMALLALVKLLSLYVGVMIVLGHVDGEAWVGTLLIIVGLYSFTLPYKIVYGINRNEIGIRNG